MLPPGSVMKDFRTTVEIHAPPARVWAVLLDVERWPEWTPTVTRVERLETGPLAIGSRTRILQPKLEPAVWGVTELDEMAHAFTWVVSGLGIVVTARHQVEWFKSGTCATLSLRYSGLVGRVMARMLRELNWEYLTTEAEGLKRRCEQPEVRTGPSVPGSGKAGSLKSNH